MLTVGGKSKLGLLVKYMTEKEGADDGNKV